LTTSIVASGCLWQRAISCTCRKYAHHPSWRDKAELDASAGWRQANDQNFDETGFVSGVVFPAGIHRRAI
jgi:hypothetical protein